MMDESLTFAFRNKRTIVPLHFRGCVYNNICEFAISGVRFRKRLKMPDIIKFKEDFSVLINDELSDLNKEIIELHEKLVRLQAKYEASEAKIRKRIQEILNERTRLFSSKFKEFSSTFNEDDEITKTYIIQVSPYLYKIGKSKNIKKRLMGFSDKSKKLIAFKYEDIEHLLHCRLGNRRRQGSELFDLSESEVNRIINLYKFERYED